jgi:peptidoglycan/LPS O-acetylase OafA/YrhL
MSGVSPEEPSRGSEFRPELEGLRAVAIGLVLLYHANIPRWDGGYVGVDVFFVLSGFLITGLIVRELRATGRVDLPQFYARRARRLLPAAAVALVGTLVLSVLFLPPLRVADVAGDAAAASLYVSNLRFALQATDYLASDLAPSPLLHFWSLGVEEQFYLFWPALLLGVSTLGWRLRRRVGSDAAPGIVLAVVVVIALSFLVSLVLTSVNQPWAFFTLPARAWELGLGALLALGASRLAGLPVVVGGSLVAAGLGLVTLSGLILKVSTPFPGTAALLPTVGAALVIAGGAAGAGSLPVRLLTLAPMRFLGRISYSLYLWHWPILVLPAAAIDPDLPLAARLALVAVSIIVAAASQHWVEDPIRHGRIVGRKVGRTLALAGVTSLVVALLAVGAGTAAETSLPPGVTHQADDPNVLPPDPFAVVSPPASGAPGSAAPGSAALPPTAGGPVLRGMVPSLGAARNDVAIIYDNGCHLDQRSIDPKTCVFGDTSSPTTVVLFGDSHAAQWFPTFDRLANVERWRLVTLTKSACSPAVVTVWNVTFNRAYTECDAWREKVFELISSTRPALVVMAMSRAYTLVDGSSTVTSGKRPDLWDAGIAASLRRLSGSADRVALIGDTPRSKFDPPVCLSKHLDDVLACTTPSRRSFDVKRTAADQELAAAAGVTFVDPTAWVCPTEPCPVVIGNYLVFRDSHHMTTPFATALARRMLAALPPPLGGPSGG